MVNTVKWPTDDHAGLDQLANLKNLKKIYRTDVVETTAVVVATGGLGQAYAVTTNPAESTGDGLALAWRAGAAVADMEFVREGDGVLGPDYVRQLKAHAGEHVHFGATSQDLADTALVLRLKPVLEAGRDARLHRRPRAWRGVRWCQAPADADPG